MVFKKITLFILLVAGAVAQTFAQDLIAEQVPIDYHTKVVDSVHLARLIVKEKKEMPAIDLYDSWNTKSTHCYGNKPLPREFKIDLRGYVMPTDSRRITSSYGYRRSFRRFHKGMDIKVYIGDTIRAAFDGKIRRVAYERRGYGNYVVIRHPNGLETYYAHMSKHLVKTNQIVKAGQPIGLGGNTGRSTGSHLHFECRLLGQPINPALLFDFPNQDVTGDFYVYRNNRGIDPNSFLVSNERSHSVELYADEEIEKVQDRYGKGQHVYITEPGDTPLKVVQKLGITFEHLQHFNKFLKVDTPLHPRQILRY